MEVRYPTNNFFRLLRPLSGVRTIPPRMKISAISYIIKHNGNINKIPLISYKTSGDVYEKRPSIKKLCYNFQVRINLDNNMSDLPSKFSMRIHFTNGRGIKELGNRFGYGMDRNAYISLRAWHSSTLTSNLVSFLLDLGQYMTSFFNSSGGWTYSSTSGCTI